MYTTLNGVTSTEAADYHPPAAGESPHRIDAVLRRAERAVLDLTTLPVPTTEAYTERAHDAELAAFEWLFEHRPYFSQESLDRSGVTYASGGALALLITSVLGIYSTKHASFGVLSVALKGTLADTVLEDV